MRRLAALLLFAPMLLGDVARQVTPGAAGPNRLDVDVPLLAHATRDLRDLRLLDTSQREIGYLLVDPPSSEARWRTGRVLPIAATKFTSGFEADFGAPADVDRLRINGIAAPFLKRVRVEGSGDRAHWTLLADATVFDLPDQQLLLLEVRFEPGAYRYLRATWDDRSSTRITSAIGAEARLHGGAAEPEPLRASVAFTRRPSEPGRSRYRIHLPGPHLPPAAIEVRVANGNVYRRAAISEARLGNGEVVPVTIGAGVLRRAERWGAVAEEMAIRVGSPEGRELDLVLEDDDNPPLAITQIVVRFAPQPWIYFEAQSTAPLTARYGNPRRNAPRYDLEASRAYLRDTPLAIAHWGDAAAVAGTPPAATDTVTALQGAPVDRDAFRVARPIPQAPAGLAVLVLDADAITRSNDLADLRIVDAKNAQIPYLLEKRDEPLVVPLMLERADPRPGTSAYRFELPFDTPAGAKLVYETSGRVFERGVKLLDATRHERRGPVTVATAVWRATDPELPPPALALEAPMGRHVLELVVDEGDNAPLPIVAAKLLLPSTALRFHHPGTPLFLLYGNVQAATPRYDLSLLAPRLFGEPARELHLTPLARPQPQGKEEDRPERKYFWFAIVGAAVVLLVLLARLLVPRPVSG